jgi:isopenicillin-N N-acyltransferase like protein
VSRRALRAVAFSVLGLLLLGFVAHRAVVAAARIDPPSLPPVAGRVTTDAAGVRWFDTSYVRRVGRLWETRLVGSPAEIGAAHGRLLYDGLVATEQAVWDLFRELVPSRVARTLILDLAQWHHRNVARGFPEERLIERAAQARAFSPDPFEEYFPTFQRFVYLSALYDISLGFEQSPLIGCTTFVLADEGAAPLLARAFDFEVHDVFDEQKAVFLVRETGQIPFASVAWPGLLGVLSGMNVEGLAAVVHGARAGPTRAAGEPVVHALRRVLSVARSTPEAVRALAAEEPMVSHIVIVLDAEGRGAAIERVPGAVQHVRALSRRDVVTNHLYGAAASDPKNQRVRATTSTLPREARGREIVTAAPGATAEHAVALLRDRRGVAGADLPLGDRRAIDALIATHGVVMDTENRTLWVSEAPHLLGRFVSFDLRQLLATDYAPSPGEPERHFVPADPMLADGTYAKYRHGSAD